MSKRIIYPARRAVEHAVTQAGVRPLRLFPVLWPLWQVEVVADVYDEQAYEVIDRFLIRAVNDCGIDRTDDLAAFFGLSPSLVTRCLKFLELIGHISIADGHVRMEPLGRQSFQTGVRLEPSESRQKLLIERFTGRPLPRSHYDGSAAVLPTPQIPPDRLPDRTRFLPLFCPNEFAPALIEDLVRRPDRAEYNLPGRLRHIRDMRPQDAYLPAYLIETTTGVLAYTAKRAERDPLLEGACGDVPSIAERINAERFSDPRELWTRWLADKGHGPATLDQVGNGVWRATFAPRAFGAPPRLPLRRLGSYQLHKHHFIQLWCQDRDLRRHAVMERALAMAKARDIRTVTDLTRRIDSLSAQLDVRPAPTISELKSHGEHRGEHDDLGHLDALA